MKRPQVIAHRGLWVPKRSIQNTQYAVERAVRSNNYGVEIDFRMGANGELYVTHDATPDRIYPSTQWAAGILDIAKTAPIIALNWKEAGTEKSLIDLCREFNILENSFIFDHPTSSNKLLKGVNWAVRCSDRPDETVARALKSRASVVWADEFSYPYITEDVIDLFHANGKKVYCVSAELHDFPRVYAWKRWRDWTKADGICTDDPQELDQFLRDYVSEDGS